MYFFKRLGFEKADERNIYIGFYSSRLAWLFTTSLLFIWSWYDLINTGNLSMPFILFSSSQAVYWLSHLYYSRKLGG